MVSVYECWAVAPAESVTVMVTGNAPAVVGVPVMTPPAESVKPLARLAGDQE
jgi:hypothetical protein